MQAVTHMAFGAALAVLVLPRGEDVRWRRGRLAAGLGLAALSHPLLDDLARATYHPPEPRFHDPFWVAFHLLVAVATLAVAWRLRRHGWFMAAALTPDLDWVIGRPLGLWSPGTVHDGFRAIPGLATLSEGLRAIVPDARGNPAGAAFEVLVVAGLLAVVWRFGRRRATPETQPSLAEVAS